MNDSYADQLSWAMKAWDKLEKENEYLRILDFTEYKGGSSGCKILNEGKCYSGEVLSEIELLYRCRNCDNYGSAVSFMVDTSVWNSHLNILGVQCSGLDRCLARFGQVREGKEERYKNQNDVLAFFKQELGDVYKAVMKEYRKQKREKKND